MTRCHQEIDDFCCFSILDYHSISVTYTKPPIGYDPFFPLNWAKRTDNRSDRVKTLELAS